MQPENTVDEFFKGLPSQDKQAADVFSDKSNEVPGQGTLKGDEDEPRKNRRHRRLEDALQRERESNIALAERIKTLSEVEQFKRDTQSEGLDPELVRVFGDSDQGKEVARIMATKLSEAQDAAEERVLQRIRDERVQELEEQKKYESVIDSELESLEDQYNIDLTSDSPRARKDRREFLEMIQNLSPKDENGTITGYADFGSSFEIFQKNRENKSDTTARQKEIAARSMQRSGQAGGGIPQQTTGFDGWKKDYGLE